MNRHFSITLLSLVLVCGMTSCLKDDINSTIIYSSQVIPDINTYMPPRLIQLMGKDSLIHYGDEPPRFSGLYTIKDIISKDWAEADSIPPGNYGHIMSNHNIVGNYDFTFYDQVKGILQNKYSCIKSLTNPTDTTIILAQYETKSNIDTAYYFLKDNLTPIKSCPDYPVFFSKEGFDPKLLQHAYIIGNQNEFTIFYYDVPIYEYDDQWIAFGFKQNKNLIVMANIISGELTEITPNDNDTTSNNAGAPQKRYRIDNFYWGVEAMGAIREDAETMAPVPGDAQLRFNNNRPIYPTID